MSHPNPMHDPENVREDDDLLRQEEDARRWEEEKTAPQEPARSDDLGKSDLMPQSSGPAELVPSFASYWAQREQDMRDQKEFFRKWDERWNKGGNNGA